MTIQIWLLVCAATGFFLRKSAAASLISIFIFWALLPGIVQHKLFPVTSGFPPILAGSWLIISVFVYQVVTNYPQSNSNRIIPKWAYLTLVLAMVLFLVSQITSKGWVSTSYFVNQLITPLCLFWIARVAIVKNGIKVIQLFRNLLLGLATIEFLVVLSVSTKIIRQPYLEFLSLQSWYTQSFSARQLGTFDHPLVLSVLFLIAIPLTASLKHVWLQIFIIIFSLGGILLTQSRTALILAIVPLAYLILRSQTKIILKICLALGLIGALYFVFGANPSLAVLERFSNDGGSTQSRINAYNLAISQIQDFLLLGKGAGTSYGIAEQSGLSISFENPFLMFTVDFGFIGTLLYFGTQLILSISSKNAVSGVKLAAFLAFASCQGFSSVTSSNFLVVLPWLLVAMSMGIQPNINKMKKGLSSQPVLVRP